MLLAIKEKPKCQKREFLKSCESIYFYYVMYLYMYIAKIKMSTMLQGNSTHRPLRLISMLFIVVRRIRQCTELPVMTVLTWLKYILT